MGVPAVNQTELDGALGVLPPSSGELLALAGYSSSGTVATPATYGSATALATDFGVGPLVEAAARHIATTGKPVCVCNTGKTTDGSYSAVTTTRVGSSTCAVTAHAATKPNDDLEVYIRIVAGGTIGIAGITFVYSFDGGRTLSQTTALGTVSTYVLDATLGVQIDLAAGTLSAGDYFSFRTVAPAPNTTQIGVALAALAASQINWKICEMAFAMGTGDFDQVETSFASMFTAGKFRAWVGSIRTPDLAESEATYLAAMSGFAAKSTKCGELCAGACEFPSGISGRIYRRPISMVIGSREAAVTAQIDIADITLGALVGVSITDALGAPKHHDETANPGLDDARFTTLRTWEGRSGVFVTRPRIFSSAGSDFYLMPHRRVMNLARTISRAYLEERLSKPIVVDATTGFILEEEAVEIESGCNARLRAVLGPAPMASGWREVLARNDNLLSTRTLTATTRIIPLAYVEWISESIGFTNPALQVVTA